jgi:transposase, IS5 family
VGIDPGREPVADETTVCKFRHLLREHELGERLFERVGKHDRTEFLYQPW